MVKGTLTFLIAIPYLHVTPVKAELSAEYQRELAELWEAAFFISEPDGLKHLGAITEDYTVQNQLSENEVSEYRKTWAKQNWQRIYRDIIDSLDDTPLESASDPDVASGKKLPPEFISGAYLPNIIEEVRQVREKDPFFPLMVKLGNLQSSAKAAADIDKLPTLLKPYSDSLPPTKRDLAIANTTIIMIMFMEYHDPNYRGTSVNAWEPLVNAKNPLYRYLSLGGISSSVPKNLQPYYQPTNGIVYYLSAREKFTLYQQFFEDDCELIRIRLCGALSDIPIPDSLEYLKAEKKRWEAMSPEEDRIVKLQVPETVDPFAPVPATYQPPQTTTKEFSTRSFALGIINESIENVERKSVAIPEKYKKMMQVYEQTGKVVETE